MGTGYEDTSDSDLFLIAGRLEEELSIRINNSKKEIESLNKTIYNI